MIIILCFIISFQKYYYRNRYLLLVMFFVRYLVAHERSIIYIKIYVLYLFIIFAKPYYGIKSVNIDYYFVYTLNTS